MNNEELAVNGVGEYIIVYYDNGIRKEHVLKYIQEDSIIKSINKKFLVLRHATVDPDLFMTLQNRHSLIRILGKHIVIDLNNSTSCTSCDKYSVFENVKLKYMRLENKIEHSCEYKIVFEVDNIKLMQDISNF